MKKRTNGIQNLSQQLGNKDDHPYPDFDAMWTRIEAARNEKDEPITAAAPIQTKSLFRGRRLAVLSVAAFVLVATPALAYIAGKWDFIYPSGVKSALHHGFGQPINKSVTDNGVTLSMDTAVSDDNGTVLLYSLDTGDKEEREWVFDEFEFKDNKGNSIARFDNETAIKRNWNNGYYSQAWDEENRIYKGFFDTSWTFSGNESNVQMHVSGLQAYDYVHKSIALDPRKTEVQSFPIHEGGIKDLKVQVVTGEKGEGLLKYSLSYTDDSIFRIVDPQIRVNKGESTVKRIGYKMSSPIELDGHRERGSQESYRLDELQQSGNTYEFVYGVKGDRIEGKWNFDNISLNKEKSLQASVTRNLDIPIVSADGDSIIRKLIIRPTGVKLEIENKKEFRRIPYRNVSLLVNDRVLKGWETYEYANTPSHGYKQMYTFRLSPEMRLTAETPIQLLLENEIESHRNYKESIKLQNISDEKREQVVDIVGYPVKLSYYTKDGDLYVENESENLSFSGVTQTYMKRGEDKVYGEVLFHQWEDNWLDWENSNKFVNIYRDFKGSDAELYLYEFQIRHRDRGMKVKLQ
ncbi:DUF4179 domain-containing protein [Paenibacillus arenosi]|uniref:DUF4179 domain-containing protein n=1 Tax=Paenibacillus arenosi TaxID=2774142 RepID=A0ABR9B0W6_9BACL|nr:DUF4179 domain-containing protein [Paenibacillus arenosi]MBD8499534.1 DUF4179 domain-containing protein [Paenibacillus arenosi]